MATSIWSTTIAYTHARACPAPSCISYNSYCRVFHSPRSTRSHGWSLQLLSTSTTSRCMWESHPIMQMHALFATAADTAFSSSPAADTRLPSEHMGGHLWNQSVLNREEHGTGSNDDSFRESLLSLLDDMRDDAMAPKVFEGVPVACDYLKRMDTDGYGDMATSAVAAYSLDSVGPHAGVRSIEHGIASSLLGKNSSVVQWNIQQQEVGAPMAAFLQQLLPASVLDQSGIIGTERVCPDGSALEASFCMRTSPDVGSFSCFRSATPEESISADTKEQEITRLARTYSSTGSDPNKKKRSEERGGGTRKKFKSDTSHTSSPKHQAPKVKLGEKITALQQIVSPFGKTDTASVLLETINYIKFLHEQIQDHINWGDEEKRKAGVKHDLRGRGLCLGPVSWTSQAYCDNILPGCWALAYRNYFYR